MPFRLATPRRGHERPSTTIPCHSSSFHKAKLEASATVRVAAQCRLMTAIRPPANKHVTSVRKPDDFDAFWADLMARAACAAARSGADPGPVAVNDLVETFEIHYTSLDGLRIAGWYCRPRESALEPPYPALIVVPGYVSEPTLPKQWAQAGYAAVGVAPHGKLRSNARFNPGYPGLLVENIIDKRPMAPWVLYRCGAGGRFRAFPARDRSFPHRGAGWQSGRRVDPDHGSLAQ